MYVEITLGYNGLVLIAMTFVKVKAVLVKVNAISEILKPMMEAKTSATSII